MKPLYHALICCLVKLVLSMRKVISSLDSFLLDFPPIFARVFRRETVGVQSAMVTADGVEGWRRRRRRCGGAAACDCRSRGPGRAESQPNVVAVVSGLRGGGGVPRDSLMERQRQMIARRARCTTTRAAALINAPSYDLSGQADAEASRRDDGEGLTASPGLCGRRCYVYSPLCDSDGGGRLLL